MGTKYTVVWLIGNRSVNEYRTNNLLSALYHLWFWNPQADFVWKSLEIR